MSYLGLGLLVVVVAFLIWKHKTKVRGTGGSFEKETPKEKQK
jgi:hypothetical protein